MSAISSPVSSGAEPPHSPAGSSQHDCSPLQLTPRSKVRALLAAIDGDSDPESASKPQSALQNALTTEKAQRDAKDSNQNQNGHGASVLTIPRGKIAARLQRQQSQRQKQISSGDDHAESAYERVKMKEDLDKQRRDGDGNMQPQLPFESDDEDDVVGFSNRRLEERGTRRPGTESIPSSPSVNHRPSPALFLSSSSSQPSRPPFSRAQGNGSDSDRPSDPKANQRFLALVARKKKEREEKAAAEKLRQQEWHQQQAKVAKRSGQRANVSSSSEDEADAEGAQKLTQQARPTRKASKKALEEMSRETQRMSRNMQLAHQAKTRRKITKESLFARFNFQANTSTNVTSNQMNISSTAASSVPGSDSEIRDVHESPPTSPLGPDEMTVNIPQPSPLAAKVSSKDLEAQFEPSEENLPDIVESVAQCSTRLDKGKGRATDDKPQTLGERKEKPGPKTQVSGQRQIKLRLPEPANKARSTHSSDSDLEIVPERKKMKASKIGAFERLTGAKATEGHSLQTLRALANLSSPSKNDPRSKPSMALSDMQTLLQSRARQQAAQERAEKIQELKSKGIIIQTAEEREKDQMEIEDLLEKARREAEELKQKEKEAAKIEAKATGAALDEGSSEEDEDYQANDADESDIELSGSDEERIVANASDGESEEDVEDEKEEEGGIGLAERSEGLIDNEASDTSDDETKIRDSGTEGDEASMDELTARAPRARKRILVIDDDEEEGEVENEMDDSPKLQSQLGLANEFLNPLPIIPGLPLSDGASLGLTQAFAATMADTRNHEATEHRREGQRQHSPIFPSPPPEPDIPMFHMQDSLTMEDSEQVVLDSQNPPHLENQEGTQPNLSQAPSLPQDSIVSEQMPVATQMSDMPDPTQDVGFANSSPIANRFVSAPPSTQDTLIITQAVVPESPIVKKKGRLRRGKEPAVDGRRIMEVEPQNASANAFDILKMASKKPRHEMENFNKKNSKAQEMVEEQAQESEDEYAGLGGASDEDSGEEPDEEVKKMIEEGDINVDERELAAFYA